MHNFDLFAEIESPKSAPAVKAVTAATLNDCRSIATVISDKFGQTEVMVLMQRFGSERLKDLPDALMQPFHEFACACLLFSVPPSASWSNDNIPTSMDC